MLLSLKKGLQTPASTSHPSMTLIPVVLGAIRFLNTTMPAG